MDEQSAVRKRRTGVVSTRARWLLLIGATVLALCCAEVLLRFVWHNPFRYDGPDRIVNLRLHHANTHHRVDRSAIHPDKPIAELQTNDRSYIMPAQQLSSPDCTIAFLGGSTTECFAVHQTMRFPALVASRMGELGVNVNTLNAGMSGNTIHDSINTLFNHVVQDSPDIVVLMHACNDVGVLSQAGNYGSRSGQFLRWPRIVRSTLMHATRHSYTLGLVRQVLREHTYVVPVAPDGEAKEKQVVAVHVEELDTEYERRLRTFVRMCKAFEITPVVMTQPISGQFTSLTPQWADEDSQHRFNEIIRRGGREERVLVIDLVKHVEETVPNWDEHLKLFYDGLHVTDEGSRTYGEHIVECLLPLVRDASAEPIDPSTPDLIAAEPESTQQR